jgi:hypothetical protein
MMSRVRIVDRIEAAIQELRDYARDPDVRRDPDPGGTIELSLRRLAGAARRAGIGTGASRPELVPVRAGGRE